MKRTRVAEHILYPLKSEALPSASEVAWLQKEDLTLEPLFSKCVPEATKVEGRKEVSVVKEDLVTTTRANTERKTTLHTHIFTYA